LKEIIAILLGGREEAHLMATTAHFWFEELFF
jgi:hypothetical protein